MYSITIPEVHDINMTVTSQGVAHYQGQIRPSLSWYITIFFGLALQSSASANTTGPRLWLRPLAKRGWGVPSGGTPSLMSICPRVIWGSILSPGKPLQDSSLILTLAWCPHCVTKLVAPTSGCDWCILQLGCLGFMLPVLVCPLPMNSAIQCPMLLVQMGSFPHRRLHNCCHKYWGGKPTEPLDRSNETNMAAWPNLSSWGCTIVLTP